MHTRNPLQFSKTCVLQGNHAPQMTQDVDVCITHLHSDAVYLALNEVKSLERRQLKVQGDEKITLR
jgi:hypothetical protein